MSWEIGSILDWDELGDQAGQEVADLIARVMELGLSMWGQGFQSEEPPAAAEAVNEDMIIIGTVGMTGARTYFAGNPRPPAPAV